MDLRDQVIALVIEALAEQMETDSITHFLNAAAVADRLLEDFELADREDDRDQAVATPEDRLAGPVGPHHTESPLSVGPGFVPAGGLGASRMDPGHDWRGSTWYGIALTDVHANGRVQVRLISKDHAWGHITDVEVRGITGEGKPEPTWRCPLCTTTSDVLAEPALKHLVIAHFPHYVDTLCEPPERNPS